MLARKLRAPSKSPAELGRDRSHFKAFKQSSKGNFAQLTRSKKGHCCCCSFPSYKVCSITTFSVCYAHFYFGRNYKVIKSLARRRGPLLLSKHCDHSSVLSVRIQRLLYLFRASPILDESSWAELAVNTFSENSFTKIVVAPTRLLKGSLCNQPSWWNFSLTLPPIFWKKEPLSDLRGKYLGRVTLFLASLRETTTTAGPLSVTKVGVTYWDSLKTACFHVPKIAFQGVWICIHRACSNGGRVVESWLLNARIPKHRSFDDEMEKKFRSHQQRIQRKTVFSPLCPSKIGCSSGEIKAAAPLQLLIRFSYFSQPHFES